jgi:hypothetical protein
MASFVPYHGKKRDRLHKLEDDLRRLIEHGASHEKLLQLAIEVRDCRIRVLRAEQNKNPERTAEERAKFLEIGEKINAVRAMTAEEVLAPFLQKAARS